MRSSAIRPGKHPVEEISIAVQCCAETTIVDYYEAFRGPTVVAGCARPSVTDWNSLGQARGG